MTCMYGREKTCSSECREWIDFPEEKNCTLFSVEKNGAMSLQKIAERLKINVDLIKMIEERALKKIKRKL